MVASVLPISAEGGSEGTQTVVGTGQAVLICWDVGLEKGTGLRDSTQ